MHIMIVFAHPEPQSFCGAMVERARIALEADGHSVTVSDLYRAGFDPVGGPADFADPLPGDRFHYQSEQRHAFETSTFAADIATEQDRIAAADAYLFVFPLWWGGVPAILKGWFDRVLSYGFAYEDGMRYDRGYFHNRVGMLGIATGGTLRRFTEGADYGSIEQVLWPTQHCMIEYMGLTTLDPFVAYAAPRVTDEERAAYLDAWEARVLELASTPVDGGGRPPGPPPGVERPSSWITAPI